MQHSSEARTQLPSLSTRTERPNAGVANSPRSTGINSVMHAGAIGVGALTGKLHGISAKPAQQ
eukprot:1679786-Amphidinium_carterae.1